MSRSLHERLPSIASLFQQKRRSRHGKPDAAAINVARAGTQAANRFTRDEYADAVHQLGGAAQAIGDAAAAASEITSKGNPSKVLKLGGELSAALGTLAMALPEARSIARAALVELQLMVPGKRPKGPQLVQKKRPAGPVLVKPRKKPTGPVLVRRKKPSGPVAASPAAKKRERERGVHETG